MDPLVKPEVKKQQVLDVVRASFKPEFINRLDDMVVFSALSGDELAHIAGLQIDRLAKRLADRRLTLEVSPEALAWLAEEGNDPAYGARPLRPSSSRARSATGSPRRSCPARSATVTPYGWSGSRTG